MTYQERLLTLRKETRKVRQDCATYFRAWESQKKKAERLKQENADLKKKNEELATENTELKNQLSHEKEIRDKFQGMLFKASTKSTDEKGTRKPGGQPGHKGIARKKPDRIDQEKEVYLSHCPHCQNELSQTNGFYERTVEDIILSLNTIITKYHIQRQWCSHCQKEVCATPKETIENSPFGINILIWALIQRYRLRLPLNLIVASLKIQYDLKISEGALQKLLQNAKVRCGPKYQELIEEIRKNKLKHADETGWRINGQNCWCWMFSSPQSIIYTIEETRGKGVPKKILGEKPEGVLVRDDFGSYKHLAMPQQSCWAHLLRNSREKVIKENASTEMKKMHDTLKEMFSELSEIIERDSTINQREKYYPLYRKKIQRIIKAKYLAEDAKELQIRITNQNTNLITALLYPGTPLTNNEAERNIRKMVVTRKISGGSRSNKGAMAHAVNMSIIQTLTKQKESLVEGLRTLLTPVVVGYSLEKGE